MKLNLKVWLGLAALTGSLVFFQNCGSGGSLTLASGNSSLGSNQPQGIVAHAPTAQELEGLWNGPCEPVQPSGSFRMTIIFGPLGNTNVSLTGYSDNACLTQIFLDLYTATTTVASSTVANSARLNFTVSTAQRAPVGAANATAFNTSMMCGQTGWVANVGKAIAIPNACLLFTQQSSTIAGIDGTKLYFGNDADTALDPSRVYNKQ